MADILKLKKKAADFEAKRQMDKALVVYREMIEVYESGEEYPIDIPLYNRVGDLLQKAGHLPEAVSVWEHAVDHYTEGGFYNPAIALCNKILRQSPGRTVVYYKLGRISAEKGFRTDARENFLEYAARMQKAGNLDEAFRALKEFADLVPDQGDVRVMLADQLVKANRKDEAVEQLQVLHAQHVSDGRDDEMREIVAKMKAIDPSVEPRAEIVSAASKSVGLVFLDVEPSPRSDRPSRAATPPPMRSPELRKVAKAIEGLELLDLGIETPPPIADERPAAQRFSLLGLETTSFGEIDLDAPGAAAEIPKLEIEGLVASVPAPARTSAPPPSPVEGLIVEALPVEAPPVEGLIVEAPSVEDLIVEAPSVEALPVEPPVVSPPPAEEPPPETMFLDMEVSDFVGFGDTEPLTDASPVPQGFELLEIESSEGVHALPLDVSDALPIVDPAIEYTSAFAPESELAAPVAPLAAPDTAPIPEPVSVRSTSVTLAYSVDSLRDQVEEAPDDPGLRRQYAEALLDDGQREEGIAELALSLAGYESAGDLDTAASIAEEIVRLAPTVIRYHQKRVEFAFRANDRRRLAEAYVELADALVRDGQSAKARVVYQRVLDIAPDDLRAQAALETIADMPVPEPPPVPRRSHAAAKSAPVTAKPAIGKKKKPEDEDDYVSLGDWLREDAAPKNTRMVVEEKEPTGDEQADFNDMLRAFKQGIADNVDDEDHEAHYDLGVAYKEMGLLDEAISEFQITLRGTTQRVRAFEALGHCFVEKGQLPVASTILQRALNEPGVGDEELVGVLYLLGAVAEELQLFPDAKRYYQRVFAVDIRFRDLGERLTTVERRLS